MNHSNYGQVQLRYSNGSNVPNYIFFCNLDHSTFENIENGPNHGFIVHNLDHSTNENGSSYGL